MFSLWVAPLLRYLRSTTNFDLFLPLFGSVFCYAAERIAM